MNKILLAMLLLSSFSINAQDTVPMDEGTPPVLEESIYADDPATPTTQTDVSDAPDISKKVDEEPAPNRVFAPQGAATPAQQQQQH